MSAIIDEIKEAKSRLVMARVDGCRIIGKMVNENTIRGAYADSFKDWIRAKILGKEIEVTSNHISFCGLNDKDGRNFDQCVVCLERAEVEYDKRLLLYVFDQEARDRD